MTASNSANSEQAPLTPGLLPNLRFDVLSGFLVFLIAMPLCLAIAKASGYPPIAGIWTAVIGGILTAFVSNAELTIKGPAAGLIVIALGAVTELGDQFGQGMSDVERMRIGYQLALGIGVAAGVIQIIFGLLRAGRLADFFPLTPVHGMLASIGLIIVAKQIFVVFGAETPKGDPLTLYMQLPSALKNMNPEIATIGVVSLFILFGLPFVKAKWFKRVPAPMIVLVATVAMGVYFDLEHEHTYLFPSSFFDMDAKSEYLLSPRFLVEMPEVLKEPSKAFAFPDFRGVATSTGAKYVLLFCLIGSLESLLSAKAIELIDPWRRKTNHDRDLLAIGIANAMCSAIGGLPMISEIVRSKANIDNGARTRFANMFHGIFLLCFVLAFPNLIHRIPSAALAAMLVYTGFRLASPREFIRTYRVGSEQFIIFVGTIGATLATDLLIGIGAGIAIKLAFHFWHGAPLAAMLKADVEEMDQGDDLAVLNVMRAAVFTNWMGLRAKILKAAETRSEVVLDLSRAKLVDHTVMEKLEQLESDFHKMGKRFVVIGLDEHLPLSKHPHAARVTQTSAPTPPARV